jgi:hypothetical protein
MKMIPPSRMSFGITIRPRRGGSPPGLVNAIICYSFILVLISSRLFQCTKAHGHTHSRQPFGRLSAHISRIQSDGKICYGYNTDAKNNHSYTWSNEIDTRWRIHLSFLSNRIERYLQHIHSSSSYRVDTKSIRSH